MNASLPSGSGSIVPRMTRRCPPQSTMVCEKSPWNTLRSMRTGQTFCVPDEPPPPRLDGGAVVALQHAHELEAA